VTVQVARVDLEARKIDLVLAQPDERQAVPAPLERARAAALDAMEPKPPRRRKARAEASGIPAAGVPVPASPQQVHGMKGEPPVPPDFSTSDESEDDIVFVPPTRRRRKTGNGNGNVNGNGNAKGAANGAVGGKAAARKAAAKQSAPRKSAAKAPRATSKTSKKK
jgi:ribonuclease R